MIGIVIAMESELRPYLNGKEKTVVYGAKTFYQTTVGGKDCVIVYSGIGKVNATYACTLLCEKFHPSLLISTGVSGGLGRSKVLTPVVATATCQHDVDTSPLGDPVGLVSTVNKIYFETDETVTNLFANILSAKKGIFACGEQFVADKSRAQKIIDNFDAIACDMESGAIGQVAFLAHIPYVVIRYISDGADEDASISFPTLCEQASALLFSAVRKGLASL